MLLTRGILSRTLKGIDLLAITQIFRLTVFCETKRKEINKPALK